MARLGDEMRQIYLKNKEQRQREESAQALEEADQLFHCLNDFVSQKETPPIMERAFRDMKVFETSVEVAMVPSQETQDKLTTLCLEKWNLRPVFDTSITRRWIKIGLALTDV